MRYLFLLIPIFLYSCLTTKQCDEKCRNNTRDSIIICIDTITQTKHDTTITDGEIIWVHDTIHNTNIEIKNRIITIRDTVTRYITKNVTDERTKTSQTIIKEVTAWYDIMFRWIAGILLLLLIGWIIGRTKL